MDLLALARRLARNDARLILRDKMLLTLLAFVVVLGIVGRWVLPAIDASLAERGIMPGEDVHIRFSDTFPALVTFIALWQGALMPGTVFGFLLLDEKEDDTLTAMRVSPVPIERYLQYRVALPAVLAFLFCLGLVPVIGHATVPLWQLLPVAAVAAITAPLTTLLLAAFAQDKVQGLAFTKFAGVGGLTILVGWFVAEPWQWLLGVFPPFLVCKAYWMLLQGRALAWAVLAVAAVIEVALLVALVRRFRSVAFS
jgi:fluoroquinolone transport system permease protein